MFALLAIVSALVGACPALIAKEIKTFVVLAIIYFFVSYVVYYLCMPSLDYSLGGGALFWTIILSVASIIILGIRDSASGTSTLPSALMILSIIFVSFSGCGMFNTGKYSALVGDMGTQGKTLKHWTQQNQEISPTHIRIVPQEHAIAISKTALNQHSDEKGNIVGSQFQISEDYMTLQKVKDELVYVCPLDYRSWGSYNATSGVPGYVLVNAEDQHATPKYINGYSMKYTPGAYFGNNLERYLYENGYTNKVLKDYSFEIDDELKPFWVVSVCHHTIGVLSGLVVDGVVIVDPENGKINYYDKDKVPSWVDRVMPIDIVHENLSNWGSYLNGYWNNTPVGAASNLRVPESTVLNYGSDGVCYYVTPMTSNNSKDNTMTDLVYTNSRTGVSHRYSVSGSTEDAISATVEATVKFQNLHGAAIVYENVADRLTALVPILAEDHSIRGLALVDVMTKSLSWDPDPSNALIKYQNSLGSLGSAIGTDVATVEKTFIGKVDRINESFTSLGSMYYLYFKDQPHIFTVPQTFHKVLITQAGDSVSIKYLDSESDLISVNYFDNLKLSIQLSKNQKNVSDRIDQRRSDERKNSSRTSVKNTIKNGELSDTVLDSIANQLGKKNK